MNVRPELMRFVASPDCDGGLSHEATTMDCSLRGKATGDLATCRTCKGRTQLKLFACARHGDCTLTKPADGHACCATCDDREIEVGSFTPRTNDPPAGVVIGSYKWPALIDLQIRTIRQTCGPVPILVSDDCSPGFPSVDRYARLAAICAAHPDTTLWPNVERIGHTGGDVSAFWKGITWAAGRGLRVIAKFSQRFLALQSRWLHDGAADLLASGLPLASQRCRGREIFDLRTEACLLNTAQWNRPDVLARLTPRRYWHDLPTGFCGEAVIFGVLRDLLGGVFWPWPFLGDEERYRRAPGVIWHTANPIADYQQLAKQFGITLDADFTCEGWQRELRAGTYLHG